MDELAEIFPPEVMSDIKKLSEHVPPPTERVNLWGHCILPGFSAEAVQNAYKNWDVRKTDVLIASFPKTGTNFIMEIVRRILFQDKKTRDLTEVLPRPLSFIELGPGAKFEVIDKILLEKRMFVTHLPAELINMDKIKKTGAKVIYILRNPKDQMVSWLKFLEKIFLGQVEPWKTMISSGWNTYFEHVVKGEFEINSKPGEWYPENILSWYKHRDNKTVRFIYFEDLKKNPEKEIKLIAEFLEVQVTDEKVKEIAEETSFDKIKQSNDQAQNASWKKIRQLILRKGNVGGWKDYFTVSQSERIDAIINEKLKDTDIIFKYR